MKCCLIADPSEVIRKVARHYLEQASCTALEAGTADEAMALIRQQNISAVLLDAALPGMTTIEFLSALRFSGIAHRPVVIYVTTENSTPDIRKAFSAGADTYLIKPFDRAAFMDTLRNAGLAPVADAVPSRPSDTPARALYASS